MKLKIGNGHLPVLGYCDVSECGSYVQLADHFLAEERIIYNSEKANTVFLKLYAKLKKPKNPFDEFRSYTLPLTKETKPGADDVY